MESSRQKCGKWRSVGRFIAVSLIVVFAVAVISPWFLVGRDLPAVRYDLTKHLGSVVGLVTNRTVEVRLRLSDFSFLPRPQFSVSTRVLLDGTPFAIGSVFEWRMGRGWILTADLRDVSVDERNPLLAPAIDRLIRTSVSDFKFSGWVSGGLEVTQTNADGIVRWKADARIRDFSVQGAQEDLSADVQDLDCRLSASGLADHVDLAPVRPRIKSARFNHLMLSNVVASVVWSESKLLVTEASAGFCGGSLRLYSFAFDLNRSSLGATVLAEDLESGEVLKMVRGFKGAATGRLHGKLRFSRGRNGLLRFRDAYLYSIPGEQGSLRVTDSAELLTTVTDTCLGEEDRHNLERALSRLDYSALKVRLDKASREDSTLRFSIDGSAESGETRVPVKLDITCRGSIEQLINTGLNFNNKRR